MLSQIMVNLVKFRLRIVKYSGSALIYWDASRQKFANIEDKYAYWTWHNLYRLGQFVTLCFQAFSMKQLLLQSSIDELEDVDFDSNISRQVHSKIALSFILPLTTVMQFTNFIGTLLKDSTTEFCTFYNAVLLLHIRSMQMLHEKQSQAVKVIKETQQFEIYVFIIVFISLAGPIVLGLFLFHPADSIHSFLAETLELKITISPNMVLFDMIYIWLLFAISNTMCTFMFTIILGVVFCSRWMKALVPPKAESFGRLFSSWGHRGIFPWSTALETSHLGRLPYSDVTKIYRSCQILCWYWNVHFAQWRVAFHFMSLHFITVTSAYTLIHFRNSFLSNPELFSMGVLIALFCFICAFLCKVECSCIGYMIDYSRKVKNSMMMMHSRRSYIWKVAKSLQVTVIRTTYPFCTIENETFIQFWSKCLENLVTMLCF